MNKNRPLNHLLKRKKKNFDKSQSCFGVLGVNTNVEGRRGCCFIVGRLGGKKKLI